MDKPIAEFNKRVKTSSGGKKGKPNAVCARCCEQRAAARKERSSKRKAEDTGSGDGDGAEKKKQATGGEITDLGDMAASDFFEILKGLDAPLKVRARVDAKDIALIGPEVLVLERADLFAKAVGRTQLLHWRCGNQPIKVVHTLT